VTVTLGVFITQEPLPMSASSGLDTTLESDPLTIEVFTDYV